MKEMLARARKTLRHGMKNQSGQSILVMVLVLLVLGALLMAPLLGFMSTGLKSGQMHESRLQEFYAADSGVEEGIRWIIGGKQTEGWPWTWNAEGFWEREIYNMNDRRDVYVTVEALAANNTYAITSIATTSPDRSTTVLSTVLAFTWIYGDTEFNNQNPPPSGDVHVDGNVTLGGNIQFTGTLTSSGSLTTMNNVNVTGDMSFSGDVIVENHSHLTGTLCCGGNITLGNNCAITGNIRMWGDNSTITLEEPAQIVGNVWAEGDLGVDIRTNGDIGCEGNPGVGHIHANGNINLIYLANENAIIWGTVTAGGQVPPLEGDGKIEGIGTPEPDGPPECPDFLRNIEIQTYEIT